MNKDKYEGMSAAQRKVIDDHCTTEWAERMASPWADFEYAGRAKIAAEEGHEIVKPTPDQLALWRDQVKPLESQWAAGAKKAGVDPDQVLKELKASLAAHNAAF
jgi:TRAP-type C4-dicarboxylate transport system substrate-binding protein